MLNDNVTFDLSLEDVHFFHARLTALISLKSSKVNFLLGDNGSGKSSLFEYLKLNQASLFSFPVFFISQTYLDCLPSMRGADLLDVLKTEFKYRFSQSIFEQVIRILDPSKKVLNIEVAHLSGGQAQFLKIAMGLSMRSHFYFIDEPFNNIDQQKRILLREFMLSSQAGFLLIDHFQSEWIKSDHHSIGHTYRLEFDEAHVDSLIIKEIT